mgnify:CR=1 FL=1
MIIFSIIFVCIIGLISVPYIVEACKNKDKNVVFEILLMLVGLMACVCIPLIKN